MASSRIASSARSGSQPPGPRHMPGRAYLTLAAAMVLAAGLVSYALVHARQRDQAQAPRPAGIPTSVSTSLASLMGLSGLPGTAAPDFTLTDQAGHTVSMASLRGHAVMLEFMDPHCTDICPVVSAEFIDAYRDLGTVAPRVVFLAINVNPYHRAVADMAAYSREHGLDTIPDWHFVTGPVTALRASWSEYHIAVEAAGPDADVQHSSVIYFIDPSGRERFLAIPADNHTASGTGYLPAGELAEWGRGIAVLAREIAG